MLCPLLKLRKTINLGLEVDEFRDCLKAECAWWDSASQTCVTQSIYEELRLLVGAAGMVAEKLPPAGE